MIQIARVGWLVRYTVGREAIHVICTVDRLTWPAARHPGVFAPVSIHWNGACGMAFKFLCDSIASMSCWPSRPRPDSTSGKRLC